MNRGAARAWSRLDNAAKIFPPVSGQADTKVFRFACELNEIVDETVLQEALQRTLEDFPGFQYVLKRGLFWYYLEESTTVPAVHQDAASPCGVLYRDSRSPLFSITWFGPRINVEVFHALTDGTGALEFLKALVQYYLLGRHPEELAGCCEALDYDASATQRMADSFDRYYTGSKSPLRGGGVSARAYRLRGVRTTEGQLRVIEGLLPADQVIACARQYRVTVTALIAAALMCAVHEERAARDRHRPVVVSIPINLRKYFSSQSVRNFFSVINVGYDFEHNSAELMDVAAAVGAFLAGHLNASYLQGRLDRLAELEHKMLMRVIPLPIKNLALRIAYRKSEQEYTTTLSNIGKVEMPEPLERYIRRFDVFNSTKDLQACLCTFGNMLSISFTSHLVSTDIQRRFFRILTGLGLSVELSANRFSGE